LEVVMNKLIIMASLLAATASSQALAATNYRFCFGGGRAGLYYSAVFPADQGTKTADTANAFNAFVKGKYGTMIHSECHSDGTQADAASDKKTREDSDQQSRFPSKLIETGWNGK
jgi:hypothetical protein